MIPDEVRKLLGGYATGTLTDEERNLLFSAALEHQEIFDALADEEALRELLAEPATRQTLIEQLRQQPVLDASLLKNRQPPLDLAAYTASPLPQLSRLAIPGMWDRFTHRRLAMAGGLAALLLIAGGLQYRRLRAPEPTTIASVDLPMSQTPAASVREEEPAPRPIPRSAAPAPLAARKEAAPQVADARVSNAVEQDRGNQRTNENRAAVPPSATADTADSEKKEKETADATFARQQLNQAVRDQIAREQIPQAAAVGAESTGNVTPRSPSGKIAERRPAPVTPAEIVTGGLSRGAPPPPPPPAAKAASLSSQIREIDAKVTDINGTIVSIDAGSNSGLRTGDVVEIVREGRVIATSKLSQVGATFAAGPFQRTAGSADPPRAGDTVRRAAATQRQR